MGVDPRYRAPKKGSIRASRNPEGARFATPATRGSIRPGRSRGGRSAISSPQKGLDPSVPQPRRGSIRDTGGEGVDPSGAQPWGSIRDIEPPKRARSERPATPKGLDPRHRRRGGRSVRGAAVGVDPRYRAPKKGSIRASRNPEGARSATPATRGSIRPGRRRGGRSAISSPEKGLDPGVPQPRRGSIHDTGDEGVDPSGAPPWGSIRAPRNREGAVSRGREKWTEMGSEKWTLFGLGFRGFGEGRDGSGAPRRSSRPATPTPPGG